MNYPSAATQLVAVRLSLGGAGWATPKTMVKVLGVRDVEDPATLWIGRMFAVRDAILGVGVACTKGEQRRFWLEGGLGCGLGRQVGGLTAAHHHTKHNTLLKFTPLIGIGLGVAALKQEARPS